MHRGDISTSFTKQDIQTLTEGSDLLCPKMFKIEDLISQVTTGCHSSSFVETSAVDTNQAGPTN